MQTVTTMVVERSGSERIRKTGIAASPANTARNWGLLMFSRFRSRNQAKKTTIPIFANSDGCSCPIPGTTIQRLAPPTMRP